MATAAFILSRLLPRLNRVFDVGLSEGSVDVRLWREDTIAINEFLLVATACSLSARPGQELTEGCAQGIRPRGTRRGVRVGIHHLVSLLAAAQWQTLPRIPVTRVQLRHGRHRCLVSRRGVRSGPFLVVAVKTFGVFAGRMDVLLTKVAILLGI